MAIKKNIEIDTSIAPLWAEILDKVANGSIPTEISKDEVERWLSPLKPIVSSSPEYITFLAPNRFVKNWLDDNDYLDTISKIFTENYKLNRRLQVILQESKPSSQSKSKQVLPHATQTNRTDNYNMSLDQDFTFENFVAGPSNRLAARYCEMVANGFSKDQNPLYIYGDVGLGKTHLLHAIANRMKFDNPNIKVVAITCENFVKEYVDSMQNQTKKDNFWNKYNNLDNIHVLLFDDVQGLVQGDKQQSAKEFFSIFSNLCNGNRQIVITSNQSPQDMEKLDDRLSSRFAQGLMAEISNPSAEEKEAILKKHAEIRQYNISPDSLRFMAERFKRNSTRELIGLLMNAYALSRFENREITKEFLEEKFSKELIRENKILSNNEIIDAVCEHFKLKFADLKSTSKKQQIALPRSITMYLLREKLGLQFTAIGDIFGRNHSTCMEAIDKIERALDEKSLEEKPERDEKIVKLNKTIKKHIDCITDKLTKI